MTLGNMRELGGGASLTHNIIWNLPIMDRDLMTCLLEGPSNPMRLGLIGRVETDEEFLSHWPLPGGISRLLVDQSPQAVVIALGHQGLWVLWAEVGLVYLDRPR
jgi:hypothetical protein